jgi:hypothetical protein
VGRSRAADREDLVPDDAGRARAFSTLVVFEFSGPGGKAREG